MLSMQSVPGKNHELTVNVGILNSDTLQIEVRDTGTGFTPEIYERLFCQGFTTRKEGSGLGLHYCVNVIREMGGDITAHSDGPGTGATFQVTIPRAIPATMRNSPVSPMKPALKLVDETSFSTFKSRSKDIEPVFAGEFQEQHA